MRVFVFVLLFFPGCAPALLECQGHTKEERNAPNYNGIICYDDMWPYDGTPGGFSGPRDAGAP